MASLTLSAIIALAWSLYTVASIFVALRLWLRIKRNSQHLNVSDGFMMLCWFANAVACVAITYWGLIHLKYGQYELVGSEFLGTITPAEQRDALKASVVAAFAYYVCLWSLKLSLLCQYFTLFEHLRSHLRWILSGSMLATAALFVVVVILNLTRCLPIERNWTLAPIQEFCVSFMQKDVFLTSTIANLATDILVMVLPFFILYTIPHPIKKNSERIALMVIVLLGLMSISFSIVRYVRVDHTTEWRSEKFSMTEVAIWTIFELQIAMIAGCLPSLRVLLRDKRNSRASSKLIQEQLDVDNTSMYGTLKSNYSYAANSYPADSSHLPWSTHQRDRVDSFGYPLAPNYGGIVNSPVPYKFSHDNFPGNRSSSNYSASYAGTLKRQSTVYELYSKRNPATAEYMATIAQLPTVYTPPIRYGHTRNLSSDSGNSTLTSEEVMITMALSPGLPKRDSRYQL
ncbi:hypothetical protein BDZ91DRAFT_792289 [Kalaharituber pfeilii]|nr:hypothetical protein BDZ91DRAFT_792289 [Kalaharituber pfeilii]